MNLWVYSQYQLDGVKINTMSYTNFLKENFNPWYFYKRLAFRNIIFMQDNNYSSHAACYTTPYQAKNGFKDEQLMTWHLIDHHIISQLKHNFLSILKQKLSGVHIRRCGECIRGCPKNSPKLSMIRLMI